MKTASSTASRSVFGESFLTYHYHKVPRLKKGPLTKMLKIGLL